MKKHFLALGLACVLALSLFAACSTDAAKDAGTAAKAPTLSPGTFKVGMEIGYPPMEYKAEDGVTQIGFDVDFAGALAAKLGAELVIEDTAWDAIFESLNANRYDAVISSVSITEERQQNFNITRPYIANRIVMITKNDSEITSPDQLGGLRVCAQTATTADDYMKRLEEENGMDLSNYRTYDKIINCFDELKTGRMDAVIVDSVVAAYYLGEDAVNYKYAWESDDPEPIGIALKKGNDELTAIIETAVDELYADGTMKELSIKHFGKDVTEGVR